MTDCSLSSRGGTVANFPDKNMCVGRTQSDVLNMTATQSVRSHLSLLCTVKRPSY